jgi:SAM-dependent methyltransferase
MPTFAILDFGPEIDTRHIESPIDATDFAAFERRFRPLVERRREVHRVLPGAATWPDIEPTREKILEYYLTVAVLGLQPQTAYLDVASCVSLFPNFVAEVVGAPVIRQDLYYTPGRRTVSFPRLLDDAARPASAAARLARRLLRGGGRAPESGPPTSDTTVRIECVGSDACAIPLPAETVDAISLHCSLEHFEGEADTRFATEAFRILRPGGALLVIPFYCGFDHFETVRPDFAVGCQFHRNYDPRSFAARILARLPRPFFVDVHYYTNHAAIDPSFYCAYSVCIRKGDRHAAPAEPHLTAADQRV